MLNPPINAGCLKQADQNRKGAVSLNFLQVDHLLVIHLTDDDPREFHLYAHGHWLQYDIGPVTRPTACDPRGLSSYPNGLATPSSPAQPSCLAGLPAATRGGQSYHVPQEGLGLPGSGLLKAGCAGLGRCLPLPEGLQGCRLFLSSVFKLGQLRLLLLDDGRRGTGSELFIGEFASFRLDQAGQFLKVAADPLNLCIDVNQVR